MQPVFTPLFRIFMLMLFFSACRESNPPSEGSAVLLQEPSPNAQKVSENLPVPATGEGNFEQLVADFERQDRGIWQKPELVISMLGDLEGKTVADIGASTGYFSFRLVPKAKRVIGIEIDQRFINFMDSVKVRLPEKYQSRFETRLATENDPLLKAAEADAVIIVNTYTYIDDRINYLRTLSKGMSPGAELLIIDFKKNKLPIGPPEKYKVAQRQVEAELREAGFSIEKTDTEALDYQYMILARKK